MCLVLNIQELYRMVFPGGSDGKESAWNVGDIDSIPGLGRSPEEPGGYSAWGRKESDTTEWLSLTEW